MLATAIVSLTAPALAIIVLAFVPWLALGGARRWRESAVALNAVLMLFIVVVGAIGALLVDHAVETLWVGATQRWVVGLVPGIERYRDEHGSFPRELSEVASLVGAPT